MSFCGVLSERLNMLDLLFMYAVCFLRNRALTSPTLVAREIFRLLAMTSSPPAIPPCCLASLIITSIFLIDF